MNLSVAVFTVIILSSATVQVFGNPECKDVNPKCGNWAKKGECYNNPKWMRENCERSCSTAVCEDNEDVRNKCPEWADRSESECSINEKWMTIYCRKSCEKCGTPFDTTCADERDKNGAQCTITSKCTGNGVTNHSMEVTRKSKYTYTMWRTEITKCRCNDKRVVSDTPAVETTVKRVVTDAPAAAPERAESLDGGRVAEADSYEARCTAERKSGKSCEIYKECETSTRLKTEMVIKTTNGDESPEWKVDIVKDCDLGHYNGLCNSERRINQATCTFTTVCQDNGWLETSVSIRRKGGTTYSRWRTDYTNCT